MMIILFLFFIFSISVFFVIWWYDMLICDMRHSIWSVTCDMLWFVTLLWYDSIWSVIMIWHWYSDIHVLLFNITKNLNFMIYSWFMILSLLVWYYSNLVFMFISDFIEVTGCWTILNPFDFHWNWNLDRFRFMIPDSSSGCHLEWEKRFGLPFNHFRRSITQAFGFWLLVDVGRPNFNLSMQVIMTLILTAFTQPAHTFTSPKLVKSAGRNRASQQRCRGEVKLRRQLFQLVWLRWQQVQLRAWVRFWAERQEESKQAQGCSERESSSKAEIWRRGGCANQTIGKENEAKLQQLACILVFFTFVFKWCITNFYSPRMSKVFVFGFRKVARDARR